MWRAATSKSAIIGNYLLANADCSQHQCKQGVRHEVRHGKNPMHCEKWQEVIDPLPALVQVFENDHDALHTSKTNKRRNVGGCSNGVGFARPSASIDQFGV